MTRERPPQLAASLITRPISCDDLSPASDSSFRRRGFATKARSGADIPNDIFAARYGALAVPDLPRNLNGR